MLHQQSICSTNEHSMSDTAIRAEWEEFTTVKWPFGDMGYCDVWRWRSKLGKVDEYIRVNEKRPWSKDQNTDSIDLATWICHQQNNYLKNKDIMSNQLIRFAWDEFTTMKWPFDGISYRDGWEWRSKLADVDKYIKKNGKIPSPKDQKIKCMNTWIQGQPTIDLAAWIRNQQTNYLKKQRDHADPSIRYEWEQFTTVKWPEFFISTEQLWTSKLADVDKYIKENGKLPSPEDKNKDIKELGLWLRTQQTKYLRYEEIMSDQAIREEWEQFTIRVKSELSALHQKYKTMTSADLSTLFQTQPDLWHTYHETSEFNEQSFDTSSIPRNRIISELEIIKISRRTKRLIVDMGCGKAHIANRFKPDHRFEFLNYDHISSADNITQGDIAHLPLEDNTVDYCILSLAMWGSNCQEYISEAYRILESNGRLFIIEPTKRWSETTPDGQVIDGPQGSRLRDLVTSCGFRIYEEHIDKFCMFKCSRVD
jgi:hypothetical protein